MLMNLTQADVIAALQAWVASPQGGSATNPHQMNATVVPVPIGNCAFQVQLNF